MSNPFLNEPALCENTKLGTSFLPVKWEEMPDVAALNPQPISSCSQPQYNPDITYGRPIDEEVRYQNNMDANILIYMLYCITLPLCWHSLHFSECAVRTVYKLYLKLTPHMYHYA
jgi:hypothetical protein